ncbi:MAG: transcriptional regulator [Planctomycetota bacterium]|nr:transcriptional regulator [Planctomycetota bacterium]
MNDSDFNAKLGELLGQIDSLPEDQRSALQQHVEATRDRHERLRKTIKDLSDSMDYLRLSVKYLVFDLEATRRENQYLRKMLESGPANPGIEEGEQD